MSKVLPVVPRLVFCYLEPLSLVAGAIAPVVSLEWFIPSQLPPGHLLASQTAKDGAFSVLPTERVLALQIANLYALLAMVGVGVLSTTTEPRVVHAYIWALLIADVGHFVATGAVMGLDGVMEWQEWNATMWGNLGVVILLFTVRSLYLAGYLGKDQVSGEEDERRKGGKVKAG